jgi:8-oxo-dGTP pyrophosphatase MutT (NUDIX family)
MTHDSDLPLPPRRGAVAVIVRQERLLVVRRSAHVEAPGAYCFPGGGIEPGESEADALRREIAEELGVEVLPVRRLWRSLTSWNVDLCWWLAELHASQALAPDPREVESVHWLTIDELRAQGGLLESNLAFLDAHRRGEFDL